MKKFLLLFVLIVSLSCDDGDIVVTELDFEDQTLERCDDFEYLFYKINPMSNETIAFSFTTTEEILGDLGTVMIQLDGDNSIVYRRFDDEVPDDYFCNPIPPFEPMVTDELVSTAGVVTLTTTGTLEDNDGIPSEIEDPTGLIDTDEDGLLDVYDDDDDGDNIPTAAEGVVLNTEDGTIDVDASRDSDGDGILDYLDNDDDNDLILTINEDLDGDLNPLNDPNIAEPNYLNPDATTEVIIEEYRAHSYELKDVGVSIIVNNVQFNASDAEETLSITDSILNLGIFEGEDFPITETPDFD